MTNKLFAGVITLTVAIVVLAGVLVPVINDAVDDTKVYYNNNFGPFADVEKDDTVSITMGAVLGDSSGGSMTVNGESVIVQQGGRALLLSDNLYIAHNYSYGLALAGVSKSGFVNVAYTELTLSIANGEISATGTTVSDVTESYSFDYDWCYYRANSGDYRMVDFITADRTVYFNDTDQIKSAGFINTTGEFFSLSGFDVTVVDPDLILESITATATVNEVMDNVSSVVISADRTNSSAFKFSVDNDGTPYDVYPYYFVIPYEVIGQTEENVQYSNILQTVPLVALIVILVASISLFRARY